MASSHSTPVLAGKYAVYGHEHGTFVHAHAESGTGHAGVPARLPRDVRAPVSSICSGGGGVQPRDGRVLPDLGFPVSGHCDVVSFPSYSNICFTQRHLHIQPADSVHSSSRRNAVHTGILQGISSRIQTRFPQTLTRAAEQPRVFIRTLVFLTSESR